MLPARVPNLLVNGSSGIAVGIATNVPPHNLREVVDGLCALIHDPDITVRQLMQHVKAPDFPTGDSRTHRVFKDHEGMLAVLWRTKGGGCRNRKHVCCSLCVKGSQIPIAGLRCLHLPACNVIAHAGGEILATNNIQAAYHEGRGSITMRGKVAIEAEAAPGRSRGKGTRSKGGDLIVITELPYQTNKVPRACLRPCLHIIRTRGRLLLTEGGLTVWRWRAGRVQSCCPPFRGCSPR